MAAYANLACGGKKRASTQGVQCDVKRQNDGDWEDGSRVSGCGKAVGWVRGGTEGGFKKNEITDWVAANWPASNQSLVAWMREYIMYTIHPPYIRASWNRPDASHWKSYFPVCCASLDIGLRVEYRNNNWERTVHRVASSAKSFPMFINDTRATFAGSPGAEARIFRANSSQLRE